MRHGDISNKPAQQVMFRLEQIADKISVARFTKKLTIDVNDSHLVSHLNDMFMKRDVQIIIGVVLMPRHKEAVEDYLDSVGLLFKEVILASSEEEMGEIIKKEGLEYCADPYSYRLLWI